MKEQKVNSLTSEINELSFGGNTEEEIGLLKKAKHQLTNKVKEQVVIVIKNFMFYK